MPSWKAQWKPITPAVGLALPSVASGSKPGVSSKRKNMVRGLVLALAAYGSCVALRPDLDDVFGFDAESVVPYVTYSPWWNAFGSCYIQDRTYTKGIDTVTLMPMIHIGPESFYKEVQHDIWASGAVVLLEGTQFPLMDSDVYWRAKLIRDGQAGPDSSKVASLSSNARARAVGWASQGAFEFGTRRTCVGADNDEALDEFDTIFGKMRQLSKHRFALMDALNGECDSKKRAELFVRLRDIAELIEGQEDLEERCHRAREANIYISLADTLKYVDKVVVPWGMYHIPAIEKVLRESGYVLQETKARRYCSFWDLYRATYYDQIKSRLDLYFTNLIAPRVADHQLRTNEEINCIF